MKSKIFGSYNEMKETWVTKTAHRRENNVVRVLLLEFLVGFSFSTLNELYKVHMEKIKRSTKSATIAFLSLREQLFFTCSCCWDFTSNCYSTRNVERCSCAVECRHFCWESKAGSATSQFWGGCRLKYSTPHQT